MWNNYNPTSFISPFNNPYNSNIPSQYQQQTQTQTQQYSRPQNNIIWVAGKENARSMQLQPNSTVILLDNDASKFYIKTTDDIGLGKLRVFRYIEETDSEQNHSTQELTPQFDVSQYVTKQELNNIIASLKGELSHE